MTVLEWIWTIRIRRLHAVWSCEEWLGKYPQWKKAHFFSVHIKLYYLIIIIINNNNSHYFTTQVINTTIHHLQNSISCCVVMAEQDSEVECSGHMTWQGFGELLSLHINIPTLIQSDYLIIQ